MNLPSKNPRITRVYGYKDKGYRKGYHTGIDLVTRSSDKSIYAVAAGFVLRARFAPGRGGANPSGWGNYIIIRQDDGYDVIYAHLAQLAVVQGQRIEANEKVGIQGSTGNSTGPHLHFEVWEGSWTYRNDINAADYLGIENKVGPVVEKIKIKHWAEAAIEKVKELELMSGYPDGTFKPDNPVTRAELASVLTRFYEMTN